MRRSAMRRSLQLDRRGARQARCLSSTKNPYVSLPIRAVLFDRDETLVVDVPFNGDPDRVEPVTGAKAQLDRLRAEGLLLAVVSNQSGVGRGYITMQQVDAVNRRVEELLGPFAGFFVCPHAPEDACECRKPKPKLILDAARALGITPSQCVVVGDRASDVDAAHNAGAIPLRIDGTRSLADAVNAILNLTRNRY
jgi:histidinol-phosphate phosphatase family protein